MIKVKIIVVPAAVGFVLSFFTSLISTRKAGVSSIRALIFCVVFGALGFLLNFLYSKFLNAENQLSDLSDDSKSSKSSGQTADITIEEENLTEEPDSPMFNVTENNSVFKKHEFRKAAAEQTPPQKVESVPIAQDVKASQPVSNAVQEQPPVQAPKQEAVAEEPKEEFVPVSLGKPLEEPVKNSPAPKSPIMDAEIDTLPDFDSEPSDSFGVTSDSVAENTDFAREGMSDDSPKATIVDGSQAVNHDAKTIASAIQTILAKE